MLLSTCAVALMLVGFQNCGGGMEASRSGSSMSLDGVFVSGANSGGSSNGQGNGSGGTQGEMLTPSAEAFKSTLDPLIQTNCVACHAFNQSPTFALPEKQYAHDMIVESGYMVDLTVPENSLFVTKIRQGHGGVPVGVAEQILAQIRAWKSRAGVLANAAGITGSGVPTQAPLTPTFKSIYARILLPKCVTCHGALVQQNSVRYDSYAATMLTVVRGSAATSRLYTRTQSGSMPELKTINF